MGIGDIALTKNVNTQQPQNTLNIHRLNTIVIDDTKNKAYIYNNIIKQTNNLRKSSDCHNYNTCIIGINTLYFRSNVKPRPLKFLTHNPITSGTTSFTSILLNNKLKRRRKRKNYTV